jgi:hypothetical protein
MDLAPVHRCPYKQLRLAEVVEHGARTTGQSHLFKLRERVSLALQRALSHRECAYINKLRVPNLLPAATCVHVHLWDLQLTAAALRVNIQRGISRLPVVFPLCHYATCCFVWVVLHVCLYNKYHKR